MNSMYTLMSKLTALSEEKSTDNDFTKKPDAPTTGTSKTHKGGTKTVDDKGTKHKGTYGDEENQPKTAVKKARGRPVKPENQAAKDKPDWSGFGVKKGDVKLKPWDKAKTVKKSLKDWIENLDDAINEDGQQLQVKPLPGASQITNATGAQVGVATDPATASLVTKASNDGKLTLGGEMDESEQNHMGENKIHSYFAWRVACRKAGAKNFVGDRDIDEGHDSRGKAVGEWDGVCGSVYNNAHTKAGGRGAEVTEGSGRYMINGKEVDMRSIQVGSVNTWDSPDFTDAYAEDARFTDGTPLNDRELEELSNDGSLMNQLAHDSLYEAKKAKPDFLDKDKDGNKKEPFKKAVKDSGKKPVEEAKKAKPDFLDKDKDGNKKEPFKKAVKDSGKKKVEEASTINGKTEDPKSLRWKQTSMSSAEATKKYGKANVKVTKGGLRNGSDMVEVKVPLGGDKQVKEGRIDELSPQTLGSYLDKSKGAAAKAAVAPRVTDKAAVKYPPKGQVTNRAATREFGNVRAKEKMMSEGKVKEGVMSDKDVERQEAQQKKAKDAKAAKKVEKKPVKESVLRESHDTMQHIINSHKNEVKRFVAGEDMDEDLYDALYDYYCAQGEMPYGTMKARTGDPYSWVSDRFDQEVGYYDTPVDEGQFTQHYMDANKPAAPAQTPWRRDPIAAATDRVFDKFSTAPKAADPFGAPLADNIQFESWQQELDGLLTEGINITANTGLGDAPDSVTISATDEDAQQLLDIVKSAGLGMFAGGEQGQQGSSDGVGFSGDAIEQGRNGDAMDLSSSEPEVVDDQDGMMDLIKRMTGGGSPQNQTQAGVMDEGGTSEGGASQPAMEKLEGVHAAWEQAGGDSDEQSEQADEGGGNSQIPDMEGNSPQSPHDPEAADYEGEDEVEEGRHNDDDDELCSNCNGSGEGQYEGAKCSSCGGSGTASRGDGDEDDGDADHYRDEKSDREAEERYDRGQRTDEAYANDADKSFIADIEFMTKGLSGGLNGKKKSQSVGAPVTIASTPLKETTDLLQDWKKLAGF